MRLAPSPDGAAILAELTANQAYRVTPSDPVPPEVLAWDLGAWATQVIAQAPRYDVEGVVLDVPAMVSRSRKFPPKRRVLLQAMAWPAAALSPYPC